MGERTHKQIINNSTLRATTKVSPKLSGNTEEGATKWEFWEGFPKEVLPDYILGKWIIVLWVEKEGEVHAFRGKAVYKDPGMWKSMTFMRNCEDFNMVRAKGVCWERIGDATWKVKHGQVKAKDMHTEDKVQFI